METDALEIEKKRQEQNSTKLPGQEKKRKQPEVSALMGNTGNNDELVTCLNLTNNNMTEALKFYNEYDWYEVNILYTQFLSSTYRIS